MPNFYELNAPLCDEIIEQLETDVPFSKTLQNGDCGALYYIIKESGVRDVYLNKLLDQLERRRISGTGILLDVTKSNEDSIYKALSTYLNKCFELTNMLQSLGEVING